MHSESRSRRRSRQQTYRQGMRDSLLVILILAAPVTASADNHLPPIDPSMVPPSCATVAAVPGDATIPQPAITARIAAATCGAGVRLDALKITPDDNSLNAMMAAVKPSFDLLDQAASAGDPALAAVAQTVRSNLYAAMVVRARDSIPTITMTTVGADLAAHDQAHAALEGKLKPWLSQITAK
jgi:hypothetical protein